MMGSYKNLQEAIDAGTTNMTAKRNNSANDDSIVHHRHVFHILSRTAFPCGGAVERGYWYAAGREYFEVLRKHLRAQRRGLIRKVR